MNLLTPVSELMTKELITVNPADRLMAVRKIFDENKIHHIPVVRFRKIVGIISKSDLLYFMKGLGTVNNPVDINQGRLLITQAQDIMTTGLAKLAPTDRINVALEVFRENILHAIPVVENDELVGILTTHDIIIALADKKLEAGKLS